MFQRFAPSLLAAALSATALADATVTFDAGAEGWVGPTGFGGTTVIDPAGGNPGANMHTTFSDFGINFRNDANPEFLGDYSASDAITISIDVKVDQLDFLGLPLSRPWVLDLRNHDISAPNGWASVWYEFAWIASATHGEWTTFSVTIDDPSATVMPAGWGGYGDENEFFEPVLPDGVTFADVLANVDEIVFTTYEPGFFFTDAFYDVRIDNISIVRATGADCPGDLDGTGDVGFNDLVTLLAAWGPCP